MPCERSTPTMTALGAARFIAGINAPAPVPMSTTLLVVPYLFALLRRRNDGKEAHGVFAETPE